MKIKSNTKSNVKDEPLPSRWKSATYFQLLESVQRLNPPQTQKGSAKGGENDAKWLNQAQDVLTRLTAWSSADEGEPEAEFFHQKTILLQGLAKRTSGTSLHAEVLDSFVLFLEQNSYQEVAPIDWFFCAKILLSANVGSNKANTDLKRLADSREPVLSVYARLQSLLQSAKQAPAGRPASEGANNENRK